MYTPPQSIAWPATTDLPFPFAERLSREVAERYIFRVVFSKIGSAPTGNLRIAEIWLDTPPSHDDQLRGVAMALRHWFEIRNVEEEQRRLGILPTRADDKSYDKGLRPLSLTTLPPQLVRLKSDAPMVTLHYMQDVYDDGVLRADPWRWWFAWIAIELIARSGGDPEGERARRFVLEDPSLAAVRRQAARWLAAAPARLAAVQDRLAALVDRALDEADSPGRTIAERVRRSVTNLDMTLVDAMASEAGRVSAAITLRLTERVRRG